MKKISRFLIAALLVTCLAGCASMGYQSGTDRELHPGHVGHEVH